MAFTLAVLRQEARDLIGDTSVIAPVFTDFQMNHGSMPPSRI
jgi:hypothetical protein